MAPPPYDPWRGTGPRTADAAAEAEYLTTFARAGRHAHKHGAIAEVFRHRGAHADQASAADGAMIADERADPQVAAVADAGATGDDAARRRVHEFTERHVVLDAGPAVGDAMPPD